MSGRIHLSKPHVTPHEERELLPTQPATRAEAALSFARLLALRPWEIEDVRARATSFALPSSR